MRVKCVAFLSGKASRVILVAAFSLGAAASAYAFTPTDAQKQACTPDAFRLCSSEIPDIGRVTACMSAKKASLSAPCRAVFAAAASEGAPQGQPEQKMASAHVHRHHEHKTRSAYEHRHHRHSVHSAHAHHHHSAHWKRYAENHEPHGHHRWAGR
ncbi:MAG TPA: hypothetical protein VIJ06_01315 [Methylovirgula sp.]